MEFKVKSPVNVRGAPVELPKHSLSELKTASQDVVPPKDPEVRLQATELSAAYWRENDPAPPK